MAAAGRTSGLDNEVAATRTVVDTVGSTDLIGAETAAHEALASRSTTLDGLVEPMAVIVRHRLAEAVRLNDSSTANATDRAAIRQARFVHERFERLLEALVHARKAEVASIRARMPAISSKGMEFGSQLERPRQLSKSNWTEVAPAATGEAALREAHDLATEAAALGLILATLGNGDGDLRNALEEALEDAQAIGRPRRQARSPASPRSQAGSAGGGVAATAR